MSIVQSEVASPNGERLTPFHWKMLWASAVGYALDGMDLMIISMVLPLISAYFGLTSAQAGSIATITLIGAVIGGYVFGVLADVYGRVKVFALTILIFAVFTGLSALAPNFFWLGVFRFIAGLGLGGEFGIGMTLVAETWPKKYRARGTAGVALGFQVGVILAILTAMLVAPRFGWQGAFVVGALPALYAWYVRRNLEEPEIWKRARAERKEGVQPLRLSYFFESPRKTLTTLGLTIATAVQNFGYHGIMVWLPTMLAKELGYSFNKTGVWTMVTIVGMMIGIVVFGWLADTLGRKPTYIFFQLMSALSVWVFFHQTNPYVILFLGAVMGFFVNGMMAGYGALLAEHYPTEARSTAENLIFNTGRFIGGFGPFVIGYLAMHHSLSWAMGLISAVYLLAALAFLLFIPETKRSELV
ncbi:MFS transporter [Hydrogenibacillus schlegelii]|nr:MFS transporter [Hydrogenibacillus schlegelii]